MPITELRPEQREALPALEWLLDPSIRRTGKSFAIALAIVRIACKHPGTRIDIFDHVPLNAMRNLVLSYVSDLAGSDDQLRRHVNLTNRGIVISLPEPLDWWPPDFGFAMSVPTPPIPQTRAPKVKTKKPASKWKLLGKI